MLDFLKISPVPKFCKKSLLEKILTILDTTINLFPPPNSNELFRRGLPHLSFEGGVSFLAKLQPRFCPVKIILPGNFSKQFRRGLGCPIQ